MEREALGLGLGGRGSERQSRGVRMGRRWFWGMVQTLRTQGVLGRVPRAALRCGFSGKGSVAEGPWGTSQRTGKPGCSEQVMASRESSFSQWRGQLIVGVAPQRGLARKQRAGPLPPHMHHLRLLSPPRPPLEEGSLAEAAPIHQRQPQRSWQLCTLRNWRVGAPNEGWVPLLGQRDGRRGESVFTGPPTAWALRLAASGPCEPWRPRPLVIPSNVARRGGWNRVGGPG